jgi:Cu/Zn superoxide dismutase
MRRRPQVLIALLRCAARRAVPCRAQARAADLLRWRWTLIATASALVAGLAACKTAEDARVRVTEPAIGARLAQVGGSAVSGLVTFRPYDGGVTLLAELGGVGNGRYRIAIHGTGNCTSPNGFSAGAPLRLPGSALPVVVTLSTDGDGMASISTRIPGLAIDGPAGVRGKSVVVHAGATSSLETEPGARNDRIACGVIGALTTLF